MCRALCFLYARWAMRWTPRTFASRSRDTEKSNRSFASERNLEGWCGPERYKLLTESSKIFAHLFSNFRIFCRLSGNIRWPQFVIDVISFAQSPIG